MVNPKLIEYYNQYSEDERLFKDNQHKTELIIVLEYLKKFFCKGNNVLDVGTGTGVYSIICAENEMSVISVDISEKNLTILRKKIQNTNLKDLIQVILSDSLDLSILLDNQFDLVLNMGPIYHLKTREERLLSLKESLRVLKSGGFLFVMYLNKYFKYFQRIQNGKAINNWDIIDNILTKGYKYESDDQYFFFMSPTEVEYLFSEFEGEIINHIGTDGIGALMSDMINSMGTEDYSNWIRYQKEICEDPNLLGISLHNLVIFKKK